VRITDDDDVAAFERPDDTAVLLVQAPGPPELLCACEAFPAIGWRGARSDFEGPVAPQSHALRVPRPLPRPPPPMNAPVPLQLLQPATADCEVEHPLQQASIDRLRATFDSAAAGLVIHDDTGCIVDCNPAAEAMLALTEGPAGGWAIDPGWRVIGDDDRELADAEHPAMVTLRTGQPVHDAVLALSRSDGSRRWVLANANVLPRAGASRVMSTSRPSGSSSCAWPNSRGACRRCSSCRRSA
jgi:PAS domain S-box-containing protein